MVGGLYQERIFGHTVLPICKEGLISTWLLTFLLALSESLFCYSICRTSERA